MKKIIAVLAMLAVNQSVCLFADISGYEELAKYHAPIFYQDIDIEGMNGLDDFITKFDFDGDIFADNNWDNLSNFKEEGLSAYVYCSVTETATHWFILYGVYHPRDWDNEFGINLVKIPGLVAQHENDLEGVLLVIRRDDTEFGTPQAICTMAHERWFNYPIVGNIQTKKGYKDDRQSDDRPKFLGTHPIVFVQAEGHGIYADRISFEDIQRWDPSTDYFGMGIRRWDEVDFPNGTGIHYFPAPEAQLARPMEKDNPETHFQSVGYELISFQEFWDIRDDTRAFNSEGAFAGRHDGYDDPNSNENNPNNDYHAHAPWGWRELVNPVAEGPMISEPGEIFFDPARFVKRRFTGFKSFSFVYTQNNPSWIKHCPLITLKLADPEADSLGPNLVAITKGIKPRVEISWDSLAFAGENYGVCVRWSQGKFVCRHYTDLHSNPVILDLRDYIATPGYLFAYVTQVDRSINDIVNFYSDSIWVQVKPHRTSFFVSKDGSDEDGNGSESRPYLTLEKALYQVKRYYYRSKKYYQSAVDSILVGPGVYTESFGVYVPVRLFGSGAHNCIIGSPKKSIRIHDDSGKASIIQGFRITQQIWTIGTRVEFANNVFTSDNWSDDYLFPRYGSDTAILIENCSSYVEIIGNTFSCSGALILVNSSPKIYSNLFTERCSSAIYGQDSNSRPTIGGSASRANSFVGSRVFFRGTKPSARYNWWGTTDPEVLERELGNHVYYSNYLKYPPENAGAQIPENELGDFNNDNRITIIDFMRFVTQYGTEPDDQSWNPLFDLDFDSIVGFSDFQIFYKNYGNVFGSSPKLAIANIVLHSKIPYFLACYPNPFNEVVHINFFLPKQEFVSLKVYNVLGQEVMELTNSSLAVGPQSILWDGKNSQGRSVASGRYYIVLSTQEFRLAKPVILLR